MLQNYFKVALRAIVRDKLMTSINITGLALALASGILIYLFVTDELSFDKQHSQADRIYRTTRIFYDKEHNPRLHLASIAPPFGPLLKNDFGEIELISRTLQYPSVIGIEQSGELQSITENNIFVVEPDLFKILKINVRSGNPDTDFKRPFTVMLSENTAQKYFNTVNVIGKRLRLNNTFDLEIAGVFEDFPVQTHWHPNFLISFATLEDSNVYGRQQLETNWGNNAFTTYLVLTEGTDPGKLEAKFPAFIDKHYGTYALANFGVPADFVASRVTELTLQKVTDIHLYSKLDNEIEINGNINNVYMLSVIAIFIVLIACFNFINLSTARATKRAKEVGLRKAVGAFRKQLIIQYLSESVLISLFSLVLAISIGFLAIPWLNQFTGKQLSLNLFTDRQLLVGLILFAIFVGIIAGFYPAFSISGFKPSLVLKGQLGSIKGKGSLRKVLVVTQFAISIVLIIATAVTFQQLNFLNKRDLGYDRNQIITLTYYGLLANQYDAFYNQMLSSPAIKNVCRASRIPTGRLLDSMGNVSTVKGDSLVNTGINLKYVAVDHEFFDTYGVDVVAGRNFSKAIKTDDSLAFIINEAAVRAIGWKNNEESIGKDFSYGGTLGKVVGVVNDFHFESLHQKVTPLVFVSSNMFGANNVVIKINGNEVRAGMTHLEKIWKEMLPGCPFEYQFMDDRYSQLYDAEEKEGKLFTLFSSLAIAIACLGLFGLATFNAMQRMKEIGIRKVLGASVSGIFILLSKEIVILILVATALAWPVSWYLMNEWLGTFAYHVDMNIFICILSAVVAIAAALLTISLHTVKVAKMHPVTTLRHD